MPLIDRSVKSGTGNDRKKRWGVDRRNDIHGHQARMWLGLLVAPLCPPNGETFESPDDFIFLPLLYFLDSESRGKYILSRN